MHVVAANATPASVTKMWNSHKKDPSLQMLLQELTPASASQPPFCVNNGVLRYKVRTIIGVSTNL